MSSIAEKYLKFHRRVILPTGLYCPVTSNPMTLDADADSDNFVYVTKTGKRWEYKYREHVFVEMCKSARIYRWNQDDSTWTRMVVKIFDSSSWGIFSTNTEYVPVPKTNWGAFVLHVNNSWYTNKYVLRFMKAWRQVFPRKVKLPTVRRVHAQTIGLDLVPVQPMSAPQSTEFFLDFKGDKPTETKQQEHVIIKKNEDNPSTNK